MPKRGFFKKGQIMLLSVLTLGMIMLGATAIAGLLTVYQIRMSSNVTDSAKAIFAADAGLDWGIYQFTRPTSSDQAPVFSNGASFTATCYDSSLNQLDSCANSSTSVIRSFGRSGALSRVFELNL